MTLKRASVYAGGATLLVAWLSSAASVSWEQPERRTPVAVPDDASVDPIAAEVRESGRRLRERLASAPPATEPIRNPFAFHRIEAPRARLAPRPHVEPPMAAPAAPEPSLALMGIAGEQRPDGIFRTAMLVADDDQLIIAAVGQVLLQRYKVTAIGAETVDLTDVTTGVARRIALRTP